MRTILMLATAAAFTFVQPVAAQTWRPPPDSERCPSKWGADDQRGSGNHMGPASVLRAARLIEKGQVFELGRVLEEGMPLPAARQFDVFTKRTRYDAGSNHRSSNEELVVSEIGQVGTQFDTFSHQMIGDSLYNCANARGRRHAHRLHEIRRRAGRRAHDARRADRRRGAEARARPAEQLRDHAARLAGRARGAAPDAATRRRRPDPHGLGHALGQRQRALPGLEPRYRRGRRRVARTAGSDARRRRQQRCRNLAEPRSCSSRDRCTSSCSWSTAFTCSRTCGSTSSRPGARTSSRSSSSR